MWSVERRRISLGGTSAEASADTLLARGFRWVGGSRVLYTICMDIFVLSNFLGFAVYADREGARISDSSTWTLLGLIGCLTS